MRLVPWVLAVGSLVSTAIVLAAPAPSVNPDVVQEIVSLVQAHRDARPQPPAVPVDAWFAAARGEQPTGLERVADHPARRAWGITVIDAPIGRVWSAVNDFSARHDLTAISYAEIQSGGRCQSGRRVFQYLPVSVPFVGDRWWLVTLTSNTRLWERTQGRMRELLSVSDNDPSKLTTPTARSMAAGATPTAFSRGGWLLIDAEGRRTFAEFSVWSDPGGSIPAGVMSSFAEGSVSDNLRALTELVRQGGGCP